MRIRANAAGNPYGAAWLWLGDARLALAVGAPAARASQTVAVLQRLERAGRRLAHDSGFSAPAGAGTSQLGDNAATSRNLAEA